MRKLWKVTLAVVTFVLITGGVTTSAATKSKPDAPVLQAYLSDECPSERGPTGARAHAIPILASILGLGVDQVLDVVGTALASAAKEDKEGLAQTATVPSYLYRLYDNDRLSLQSCVVVVIAPNGPGDWCKNTPALSGSRACEGEGTRMADLLHPVAIEAVPYGSGPLSFYLEVSLRASTDQRGLLPVPLALYYPGTVNPDSRKFSGTDPRDVSIAVTGTGPSNEAAMGAMHVYFKNLSPSSEFIVRAPSSPHPTLDRGIGHTWLSVSKAPDPLKDWTNLDPKPKAGAAVSPINLSVEVREVGKPNVFLQALAAVFTQEKATIAKDLKSVVPGSAEATAAVGDALDATSKKQGAISAAYKALAALQAGCGTPGTTDTILRQDVSGYISARAAAAKLAGPGDLAKLPDYKDIGANQTGTDYCKGVK